MRMIPSLEVKAQDEWNLVPTKNRLSKTLAGSVYQLARLGGGGGATSAPAAVCGATQMRASRPGKSNPAAALAAARCASIGLAAGCAAASVTPQAAMMASAARIVDFIGSSLGAFSIRLTHHAVI